MKRSRNHYIITFIGIVLIISGILLVKNLDNPQGFLLAFPYVCIGIGCGTFGSGMGTIVSHRMLESSPALQQDIEIERHDERNIAIAAHAKAKAYDLMTYTFGALLLIFALMGIDMAAVLLLVFAYLFVQGFAVYYRFKYEKEM